MVIITTITSSYIWLSPYQPTFKYTPQVWQEGGMAEALMIECGYAPHLFTRRIDEPFRLLLRTPSRPHTKLTIWVPLYVGTINHRKRHSPVWKYVLFQILWHWNAIFHSCTTSPLLASQRVYVCWQGSLDEPDIKAWSCIWKNQPCCHCGGLIWSPNYRMRVGHDSQTYKLPSRTSSDFIRKLRYAY